MTTTGVPDQESLAGQASCSCAARSGRPGAAAVWVLVLAFVTVQLLVPVAALHGRGGFPFAPGSLSEWSGAQVRHGWQMFSTTETPAHYEVVSLRTTVLVDPVARYGWFTGRAHYTGQVAQRLCRELPEVVEIRHSDRVVRCGDG